MEILKIIAIGIVGAIASLLLRRNNSEFSTLISVATACAILFLILPSFKTITTALDAFSQKAHVDNGIFTALIKVLTIGYVTEFGAGVVSDFKENGIADKIKLAGKISIFLVTLPVFSSIITLVSQLL